jgi:lipoyl(octanoyl) transferase
MQTCELWTIGRIGYRDAWDLQKRLAAQRGEDETPDRLLLLEHPHTYTLGSSGHDEYVLMSEADRARLGVEVLHVDRGGDVTYHGPGQLVGYPILMLPRGVEGLRSDVVGYVGKLEKTIITALADFGIAAMPVQGLRGVWVETPRGLEKIAAIGVKINVKAVTQHGFALNVNTDLSFFDGIVPCGIPDKGVTSMERLLGAPQDMELVAARVAARFGEIFEYAMVEVEPQV